MAKKCGEPKLADKCLCNAGIAATNIQMQAQISQSCDQLYQTFYKQAPFRSDEDSESEESEPSAQSL